MSGNGNEILVIKEEPIIEIKAEPVQEQEQELMEPERKKSKRKRGIAKDPDAIKVQSTHVFRQFHIVDM